MPVALANSYGQLRQRLAVHLGDSTPGEIGTGLPVTLSGELSFYRLVVWGYALVQEVAKVPVGFLTSLPPLKLAEPPLPEISPLRTWLSHNFNLASKRDIKTLRRAQVWFRRSCGTATPSSSQHWKSCCTTLHGSILNVLDGATAACDALDDEVDGIRLVDELKTRIENRWEAYRFDQYVSEAAQRLGYDGLGTVDFRSRNLDALRRVVEISDPSTRERLVTQHIESRMTELMGDALPVTTSELVKTLSLSGPDRVAAALIILKEINRSVPEQIVEIIERACSGALAGDEKI